MPEAQPSSIESWREPLLYDDEPGSPGQVPWNQELSLAEEYQRPFYHKSYWKITFLLGALYALPAIQLSYQFVYSDTTVCYYNNKCAKEKYGIPAFNNVVSNVIYVILGSAFIVFVYCFNRFSIKPPLPGCGLHREHSLYYTLGVTLIYEGVFSGLYHACPNRLNFQFDGAMMFLSVGISALVVFGKRRPSRCAGPMKTFLTFTIVQYLNWASLASHAEEVAASVFWSVVALMLGYMVLNGTMHVWLAAVATRNDARQGASKVMEPMEAREMMGDGEIVTPPFPSRHPHGPSSPGGAPPPLLPSFAGLEDVWVDREWYTEHSLEGWGGHLGRLPFRHKAMLCWHSLKGDAGRELVLARKSLVGLILLVDGLLLTAAIAGPFFEPVFFDWVINLEGAIMWVAVLFYFGNKLAHGEQVGPWRMGMCAAMTFLWCTALYFYSVKVVNYRATPEESEKLNRPCVVFGYFDHHDVWHFFSATALSLFLLVLFLLDVDLRRTPQSRIAVF